MRILHVNKFLHRRGGAEAYMLDVAALQERAGHVVEYFGTDHPEDDPLTYAGSFPDYIELNPPPGGFPDKLRAVGRMLHNRPARKGMAEVLAEFRPDVVHMHNIYTHLSPSILRPIETHGIPAVLTLHDYKLACPTYRFLADGEICEACIGGAFRHAVTKRCNQGSLTSSATSALETWFQRRTGGYDPVHRFICPSRFMADKMAEAGVYPDRMRHVPHFVDVDAVAKSEPGGPVVFAGRLSPEKGVDDLVRAVLDRPELELVVAGDGTEREALEALAAPAGDRIRFLGRIPRADTMDLVRTAVAVAVPSIWYENQPMIILETLSLGVPVVTTDLGGAPELVDDGVTGRLVPARDPGALGDALAELARDPQRALEMGRSARTWVLDEFDAQRHVDRVHAVYAEAAEAAGRPLP